MSRTGVAGQPGQDHITPGGWFQARTGWRQHEWPGPAPYPGHATEAVSR